AKQVDHLELSQESFSRSPYSPCRVPCGFSKSHIKIFLTWEGGKPAARRQSVGVQIRDTPSVYVSKKKALVKAKISKWIELLSKTASLKEAQLKKAIKKSKRETNIHQAGGSSRGANIESKVPDEPKDDEEYKRINKETYDDVNVELKDAKPFNEEKGDEEMTHAENVNDEHKEVSQEVAGDSVKDDAHATVTVTPATQKSEVLIQSSSILSDYATKFLKFDNIHSGETKIISIMDIIVQHKDPSIQTLPLFTIPVMVLLTFKRKRKPDDADRDEDPPTGPDQRLKR
nr:hypothetical protein [Tanacetum cinerariifolium]